MAEPGEFQQYVLARRRSLLRTAWLLTGDWHAAEDLVQTALMRCYPRWSRIEPGAADAYVRRAIVNVYASAWRRRWRSEVPTAELPDRAGGSDPYDVTDRRLLVLAAVSKLTTRQRATVVLRFFDDLSVAETAVALGCSVGTVKSQTSKALAVLRTNDVLLTESTRDEGPDA